MNSYGSALSDHLLRHWNWAVTHCSRSSHPRIKLLAQGRTDLSFLSGGRSPLAQPSRGLSGGERKQSQTQSLSRHLFIQYLAQAAHHLDPAEGLLDGLSPAQDDRVGLKVSCGNRVRHSLSLDVRANATPIQRSDDIRAVSALVGPLGRTRFTHALIDHGDRCFPLLAPEAGVPATLTTRLSRFSESARVFSAASLPRTRPPCTAAPVNQSCSGAQRHCVP